MNKCTLQFRQNETDKLVSIVEQYRAQNQGRISERGWIDISRALNNSSLVAVTRSIDEVRRKWKNLAYLARQMAPQINLRRDRGGQLPARLQTSVRVLKILNTMRSSMFSNCARRQAVTGSTSLDAVQSQLMQAPDKPEYTDKSGEDENFHIVKVEPTSQNGETGSVQLPPLLSSVEQCLSDMSSTSGGVDLCNPEIPLLSLHNLPMIPAYRVPSPPTSHPPEISQSNVVSVLPSDSPQSTMYPHVPATSSSYLLRNNEMRNPPSYSQHGAHPDTVLPHQTSVERPPSSRDSDTLLQLQREKLSLECEILAINKARSDLKRRRDQVKLDRLVFRFNEEQRKAALKHESAAFIDDAQLIPAQLNCTDSEIE